MPDNSHKPSSHGTGFFSWLSKQMREEELPIRNAELYDTHGAAYDPAFGWRSVRRPMRKRS